jgi:hypothetical protein
MKVVGKVATCTEEWAFSLRRLKLKVTNQKIISILFIPDHPASLKTL